MVRNKDYIFAELNDEDTVKTLNQLNENSFIVSSNNKTIINKDIDYGTIIYLINGNIQELKILPNKRLGVDANGECLVWL